MNFYNRKLEDGGLTEKERSKFLVSLKIIEEKIKKKEEGKKLDKLDYRKEVWRLLKEYKDSKTMSLKEVLDKIIAVPVPGKRGRIADNRGLGDKHLPI